MTDAPARRCETCPAILSRYNDGTRCCPCRKRSQEAALSEVSLRARTTVLPRKPGAGALPRRGYRGVLEYLTETRERLALRGATDDDLEAFDIVIAVLVTEAERW